MKTIFYILFSIGFTLSAFSQDKYSFFLRIPDVQKAPTVEAKEDGTLKLITQNKSLNTFLQAKNVFVFKKAFPSSKKTELLNIYLLQCDDENAMSKLLNDYSEVFSFGEKTENEEDIELHYYPDDYGITSPFPSANPLNMYGYDLIRMPEAWDVNAPNEGGLSSVSIGMSDARVDTNSLELQGRVSTRIEISPYSYCPTIPNPDDTDPDTRCLHGTGTTAIAAGRADNNYGFAGICHDCDVKITQYGNYNNLILLSSAGAKVINMSWGGCGSNEILQTCIDEIHENGTVLVASAGNSIPCNNPNNPQYVMNGGPLQDNILNYPASYNHVISVSGVHARNPEPLDGFWNSASCAPYLDGNDSGCVWSLVDAFASAYTYPDYVPITSEFFPNIPNSYPLSNNKEVDIVAPGLELYLLGGSEYLETVSVGGATSSCAPMVTGVIGLMFSANYCLSPDEIESILKLTTVDIDNLPYNANYAGGMGAGRMDAYKAVKMAKDMHDQFGVIKVEGRNFYRFNFDLHTAPYQIDINNQTFRDSSTVDFRARNRILIGTDSNQMVKLSPGENGFVKLSIDSSLVVDSCSAPGQIVPHLRKKEKTRSTQEMEFPLEVFPNPVKDEFVVRRPVSSSENQDEITKIELNTLSGELVYEEYLKEQRLPITINLSGKARGVYILKVNTTHGVFTKRIVKM